MPWHVETKASPTLASGVCVKGLPLNIESAIFLLLTARSVRRFFTLSRPIDNTLGAVAFLYLPYPNTCYLNSSLPPQPPHSSAHSTFFFFPMSRFLTFTPFSLSPSSRSRTLGMCRAHGFGGNLTRLGGLYEQY
jgi:hypothetical protein